MSQVKNVRSVEEYNAAIAGEGLGKLWRAQNEAFLFYYIFINLKKTGDL